MCQSKFKPNQERNLAFLGALLRSVRYGYVHYSNAWILCTVGSLGNKQIFLHFFVLYHINNFCTPRTIQQALSTTRFEEKHSSLVVYFHNEDRFQWLSRIHSRYHFDPWKHCGTLQSGKCLDQTMTSIVSLQK